MGCSFRFTETDRESLVPRVSFWTYVLIEGEADRRTTTRSVIDEFPSQRRRYFTPIHESGGTHKESDNVPRYL